MFHIFHTFVCIIDIHDHQWNMSSETDDSSSDLDVEQSPTAGNIDLSNPDHIQQIINVVRDAIGDVGRRDYGEESGSGLSPDGKSSRPHQRYTVVYLKLISSRLATP